MSFLFLLSSHQIIGKETFSWSTPFKGSEINAQCKEVCVAGEKERVRGCMLRIMRARKNGLVARMKHYCIFQSKVISVFGILMYYFFCRQLPNSLLLEVFSLIQSTN